MVRLLYSLVAGVAFLSAQAQAQQVSGFPSRPPSVGKWIASWTSMPQLTEPANLPPPPFNTTGLVFGNSTLRQTIHVTTSGSWHRLRISNAFGATALPITAVTVALPFNNTPGSSAIVTNTLKTLTFSGNPSFTIPNGALVVSDPFMLPIQAQKELSISIFLAQGQVGNAITSHPGSRTTSWFAFGNHVNAANITDASTMNVAHWYFISTLDTWVPTNRRTLAIVGDSITDGRGSTTDANNRWPDQLLARLQKSAITSNIAIGNQAAGGNRILQDGLGPNALGRFDRDVLSQPGVAFAMIFEGVNDIGTADPSPQTQQAVGDAVIAAMKQFVTRAHAAGLPIFGATITPFSAPGFNNTIQPYSNAEREKTRQRVNTFIKSGGWFDAVVDFDAAVRDRQNPAMLNPAFDSGDFLHPNVAGYKQMADAFPVGVFTQFQFGVNTWS